MIADAELVAAARRVLTNIADEHYVAIGKLGGKAADRWWVTLDGRAYITEDDARAIADLCGIEWDDSP